MRRSRLTALTIFLMLLMTPWTSFASVIGPVKDEFHRLLYPPQDTSLQVYVVKPGDTLWDLSKKLGVTVADLMLNNDVSNPHFLQVGQKLLYRPEPGHEVKSTVAARPVSSRASKPELPTGTKVMYCTLTAYTAGYESTGKKPGDPGYGVTSTGAHVHDGVTVAVDPHVIPYGTRLYIPGLGFRLAEDTGGAIVGNRIDVYMSSLNSALKFGVRRNIPVYILPNND